MGKEAAKRSNDANITACDKYLSLYFCETKINTNPKPQDLSRTSWVIISIGILFRTIAYSRILTEWAINAHTKIPVADDCLRLPLGMHNR